MTSTPTNLSVRSASISPSIRIGIVAVLWGLLITVPIQPASAQAWLKKATNTFKKIPQPPILPSAPIPRPAMGSTSPDPRQQVRDFDQDWTRKVRDPYVRDYITPINDGFEKAKAKGQEFGERNRQRLREEWEKFKNYTEERIYQITARPFQNRGVAVPEQFCRDVARRTRLDLFGDQPPTEQGWEQIRQNFHSILHRNLGQTASQHSMNLVWIQQNISPQVMSEVANLILNANPPKQQNGN